MGGSLQKDLKWGLATAIWKLITKPRKGEGKYVNGKLTMWKEHIKTDFYGQDVPATCIAMQRQC